MLIIREKNIDKAKKYGIIPKYGVCRETGETYVECLEKSLLYYNTFRFIKKKSILKLKIFRDFFKKNECKYDYELEVKELTITDLELLYDLIKKGIVEKV